MSGRAVVAAVAGWVAVVAITSAVAWVAIDRAGREVLASPTGNLVQAGGATTGAPHTPRAVPTTATPTTAPPTTNAPSPSTHPTSTGSSGHASTTTHPSSGGHSGGHSGSTSRPTAGSSGTRTTPPPPPHTAQAVDRSVRVDGGQVGVRCVARTISLRFAQPTNGWQVQVEGSGPGQVKVTFKAVSGGERESEVEAECEGGIPVFSTSADGGDSGDHRESDGLGGGRP